MRGDLTRHIVIDETFLSDMMYRQVLSQDMKSTIQTVCRSVYETYSHFINRCILALHSIVDTCPLAEI